jgi:RTX calcium-binding nonapeptide repeat (4 copies)/Calpain family cysteine protease
MKRSPKSVPSRKSTPVAALETLEGRQLFSVTAGLLAGTTLTRELPATEDQINLATRNATFVSNGQLYVNGDDSADSLSVRYDQGPVTAAFSSLGSDAGPLGPGYEVFRNGVSTHRFPAASVQGITLVGFGGNDSLTIDPGVTLPGRVFGGEGTDYIVGGRGNDSLHGGAGHDTLTGGAGNDVITLGGAAGAAFGGDGDDVITGSAYRDIIEGHNGNDTINGMGGDDLLYGGAGNDSLSGGDGNDLADGGGGDDALYGQNGNDSLYAGLGADSVYGGNNEDTLVSVFGGADALNGDGGWDIFVADASGDTIADADTLATDRKSVYRISGFDNPTVAGADPVYATELGAVNIADPAVVGPAVGHASFSHLPLFTANGPRMTDVRQNQLGDCGLAAPAASIAKSTPWVIRRTVVPLGDGTFMVALGDKTFRVDADLAISDSGTPIYGSPYGGAGSSLWFPLVEKASAYYLYTPSQYMPHARFYTYGSSEGLWPGTAYNALRVDYDRYTLVSVVGTDAGEMWNHIVNGMNAGKAMSITTEPSVLGVGSALAPQHVYSIVGCRVTSTGERQVVLRNPWGNNNGYGPSSGPDGEVTVTAGNLHDSCLYLYVSE